jgi:membrane protease YdiL (CAAX protease family)
MYGTGHPQLQVTDTVDGKIAYYAATIPTLTVTFSYFWNWSSIGVVRSDPTVAIAVGLAAAPPFWLATQQLYRWLGCKRSTISSERPGLAFSLILTGILSPIVQETIHRGVFVALLGNHTSFWFSVPLGLLVFCLLHLNFGGRGMLILVAFYSVAVTLLLLPGIGLVGAMAFHIGCNTIIVVVNHIRSARGSASRQYLDVE